MKNTFRYFIELADTGEPQSWIEAFRVGSWAHPAYGKLTGTLAMFQEVIRNFKANVLGHEPVIDYQHSTDDPTVPAAERGLAAGWVKDMRVSGDRLQFLVAWTKEAAAKIREKQFRYFSPTYVEDYENKETGADVGIVMFGGALTNTPFLTGLSPVALSEKFGAARLSTDGGNITIADEQEENIMGKLATLAPDQLKVWCEAYDATEGDEATKAAAAWQAIGVVASDAPVTDPAAAPVAKVENAEPVAAADPVADPAAAPAEESEKIAVLKAKLEALEKTKAELELKLQKQAIEDQMAALKQPGTNKMALPPAAIEGARAILLSKTGDKITLSEGKEYPNTNEAIIALLTSIRDTGLVDLSNVTDSGQRKLDENGLTDAELKELGENASDDSITSLKVAKLTEKLYGDAANKLTYKACMVKAYETVHGEKK
jgi:phage I-like protein